MKFNGENVLIIIISEKNKIVFLFCCVPVPDISFDLFHLLSVRSGNPLYVSGSLRLVYFQSLICDVR